MVSSRVRSVVENALHEKDLQIQIDVDPVVCSLACLAPPLRRARRISEF